jgi:RNA polymerase sigma-54 factor
MLHQSQGQRLQQKADPQLLMTNRILQMSAMELQQQIIQEIGENPALEQPEEYPCNRCEIPGPQCAECPYYRAQMLAAVPNRDPEDHRLQSFDGAARDDDLDPIALIEDKPTLADHLIWQLRAAAPPEDHAIGEYLIANIDPNGYLGCTTAEAAADLRVPEEEVERVLRILQGLDPVGVGARSLQECLLLQIQALIAEPGTRPGEARGGCCPPLIEEIVRDYWKELSASKVKAIARGMRARVEDVLDAVTYIRNNLSPYPGSQFRPAWDKSGHRSALSVRPDVVIVINADGEPEMQIVENDALQVRLNPGYMRLWNQMRERPEAFTDADRRHVQDYIARAQMFLKSLDDRKQILLQVVQCILEEQQRFFLTEREEDLVPLTQTRVASLLRVHESTVSRTVADKYLQLPSGHVVSLSFFFDRSANLRKLVQNVLATENPRAPYSDQEISDILRSQGIVIARRTVMKYREEMNILSSRQRVRA